MRPLRDEPVHDELMPDHSMTTMISVSEAEALIRSRLARFPTESRPIDSVGGAILREPIIAGWLTVEPEPALLGRRCTTCLTTCFPPTSAWCPNPTCDGELEVVPLSTRGRIWSYTDARFQPPPPFVPATDPYEPFAIAAVELTAERLVVLGQVADGYGLEDLRVGAPAEIVLEVLEVRDGVERLVWRWRPIAEEVPE